MSQNRVPNQLAPVFLRLVLGYGFVFHGFGKLFPDGGHASFAGMLSGIGVPFPDLMAWFVGILEFVGGIGLILGAVVPLWTVLLSINMLVALFTVHLPAGFSFLHIVGMTENGPQFGMPGYEVNLLYLAGLLTLLVGGPGAYSVDAWIGSRRRAEADATGEQARAAGEPLPIRTRAGGMR